MDREALRLRRQNLGPDQSDTLRTMNDLQTVLTQEGHYSQAETLAHEILLRRQRTENEWHPDLGYSWANWGRTLELLGRYSEAEYAERHALSVRLHAYREDHPQVQWARLNLSDALLMEGKVQEGGDLARKALKAFENSVGPDNIGTAYAEAMVGLSLFKQHQLQQARLHFQAELNTRLKMQAHHQYVGSCLLRLAETDRLLGHPEIAMSELRRALDVTRAAVGPNHPAFAEAEEALADAEFKAGHGAQARQLVTAALASDRTNLPPHHPQTVRAETLLNRVSAPNIF
jgi:tetratricopeptide (TPR) repeat protein